MSNIIKITENFSATNITKKINGEIITINSYLSADDFASVVQTIANSCFENNEYRAEYREIASRYVMLKYFTDIEVEEDKIKDIFEMTQYGTWFTTIENTIRGLTIWSDIENAVDKQIDYLISTRKTSFDKLCDSLNIFLTDIAKNTGNIDMDAIKRLTDRLNAMSDENIVNTIVRKNNPDAVNMTDSERSIL